MCACTLLEGSPNRPQKPQSNQIAIIIIFLSSILQVLYVINVHLEGSPYRPNDRVSQMRSALQRAQRHMESHNLNTETCQLVVCGDFNSGPQDAVCQLLRRGRLEGGYTEAYLPQARQTYLN